MFEAIEFNGSEPARLYVTSKWRKSLLYDLRSLGYIGMQISSAHLSVAVRLGRSRMLRDLTVLITDWRFSAKRRLLTRVD